MPEVIAYYEVTENVGLGFVLTEAERVCDPERLLKIYASGHGEGYWSRDEKGNPITRQLAYADHEGRLIKYPEAMRILQSVIVNAPIAS